MKHVSLLAGVFACALFAVPARGQIIMLQATGATSTMTTGVGSFTNLINQSGLSASYTSLSTNFATYIGTSPTQDVSVASNIWGGAIGTTTGNIDFDLGGTYALERFVLWNRASSASTRVVGFTLLASADNTFTTTTNLGSFTSSPTGASTAVAAEVFTLPTTSAAFVRMQITSNAGGVNVGFGEVAFGYTPPAAVPEPSSLALAGVLGTLGAAWRLRPARG